jgi:hypothetical protein
MIKADGFPRHWKEWLGKKKRITAIPPEKDFLTGGVRRFEPIVEEEQFFYVVDWTLGPVVEKWQEVCDFVKQHVSREVRLTDNLRDMGKALAPDKTSGVMLEPEEVLVIPIPVEYQEKGEPQNVPAAHIEKSKGPVVKCPEEGCSAEFEGAYAKNSIRMHTMKKHKKENVAS